MVFLDQESAKQLINGTDTDKYKFYDRALELNMLSTLYTDSMHFSMVIRYSDASSTIADTDHNLEAYNDHEIVVLRENAEEAEALLKKYESLNDFSAQERLLQRKIEWANIQIKEKEIQQQEKVIEEKKAVIQGLKEEVVKNNKEIDDISSQDAATTEQINKMRNEMTFLETDIKATRDTYLKIKKGFNAIQLDISTVDSQIRKNQSTYKKNMDMVNKLEEKAKQQEEQASKAELLRTKNAEKQEFSDKISMCNQEILKCKEQIEKETQKNQSLEDIQLENLQAIQEKKNKINEARVFLENLRASSKSEIAYI